MKIILNRAALFFFFVTLISCEKENSEPAIELYPKPESKNAYLQVNFNDSTYYLRENVDSVYSAYWYHVPAEENGGAKILGAILFNDSSLVEFSVGYMQLELNRRELIEYLTRAEQDIANGDYQNKVLRMAQHGFLVEIVEFEYPLGPRLGYSTYQIQQPEDAYFRIGHYYAGKSTLSIWLEGSFRLELSNKYKGQVITGSFLMDFPLCCWE